MPRLCFSQAVLCGSLAARELDRRNCRAIRRTAGHSICLPTIRGLGASGPTLDLSGLFRSEFAEGRSLELQLFIFFPRLRFASHGLLLVIGQQPGSGFSQRQIMPSPHRLSYPRLTGVLREIHYLGAQVAPVTGLVPPPWTLLASSLVSSRRVVRLSFSFLSFFAGFASAFIVSS